MDQGPKVLPSRAEACYSWTKGNTRTEAFCLQNSGEMGGLDFMNEMLECNLYGASVVRTMYVRIPPYVWNISCYGMFKC